MGLKNVQDSEVLNAGYRYALALAGNRPDAEDLVQAAWLRLLKRYRKSPDKPLLYRTIRNLYIDKLRRIHTERNYIESTAQDQTDSHVSRGDELVNDYINSETLGAHLGRLRDTEREILFLSVVEGYTADEIAYKVKSVRGTVLSSLHRTKKKLRDWLSYEQHPDKLPLKENKATVLAFPNNNNSARKNSV